MSAVFPRRRIVLVLAALFAFMVTGAAWAQQTVLQGGPWTPGHFPVYSTQQGSYQPVIVDSGIGGNNNPVFGPPSSTVGDLACWANIFGTLLQDPGLAIPTANLLGGVAPAAGNCGSFASVTVGAGLNLAAGTLTAPQATSSAFGIVKPDNFSITISGGVLSAAVPSCGAITNAGCLNVANVWQDTQSDTVQTVAVSTTTYTPVAASGNDITVTISHTTCAAAACSFANPSGTIVAGTHGVIQMIQDSTGGGSIGTWGSDWIAAGGTSGLSQSTSANARDFYSYFVADSTHIVVSPGALNATH